jgi:GT2 family glycosyltransferase
VSEKEPKVAFIVVGWNNRELLDECFESITRQTYKNTAVYYIDNNSKDGSVTFVKQHYPRVHIIEPGCNTGFAKGNNIGMRRALEDPEIGYLTLLNTDARLAPEWTQHIVTFARQKPRAAILQGTTLDYYAKSIIDSTHIYISFNGQGTQGKWRYYYKSEDGPKKVFGVNAAACIITKRFLEAQPYQSTFFDEKMFMYLEDLDLSTRATVMGWDNYLVPRARAYHMGSASSGKNPGFSLYMTFRNNSALLFKNLPISMIVRMAPMILRGDFDTVRVLNRMGKKQAARKVIKGRLFGLCRLPLYWPDRRRLRRRSTIPKGYLWLLMRRGY